SPGGVQAAEPPADDHDPRQLFVHSGSPWRGMIAVPLAPQAGGRPRSATTAYRPQKRAAGSRRPLLVQPSHGTAPAPPQTGTGNRLRKECRARLSRLFTVPTGIPIASAISS